MRVWSDSLPAVRDRVVAAIESLGYAAEGASATPPLVFSKGARTIVVRFHPALLRESLTVAVKFAPHAPPSTATKIVGALAEEFSLGKVSMTEARTAAKALQRERLMSQAKLRKHRRAPAKK